MTELERPLRKMAEERVPKAQPKKSAPPSWRARVEAATVKTTRTGGQGVRVPGNLILTAAHCIDWRGTGRMALGEIYIEPIATKGKGGGS
jgi:hypothetical protein